MLTKVTRNDLDTQVKAELDGLETHIDAVEVKADQGLAENATQDTKIADIETDIVTINDVMVKSVEGILPDENGNVNLGETEAVVRSVNNQQPDGLGNVIVDDTSIPVINPYTETQSMLNLTLTSIKDSTVRTVDNLPPDANGNVSLSDTYLGKSAKAADSEKLDGVDSSSFVRSDAADTVTGYMTFNGGITINNAAFKIMNVSAPETTTDHRVLTQDASTGQVYRETQANMNVGYATNAGQLDGKDSTAFAPSDFAVSTPLYTGSATMAGAVTLSESIYNFSRADISYSAVNCYCGVSSGSNLVNGSVVRPWGENGLQVIGGCSIISADGRTLTKYGTNHSRYIVIRGGAVSDANVEGNIGSVYGMFRKYAPATQWTMEQDAGRYFRVGRLAGEILEKVEIEASQYMMTMALETNIETPNIEPEVEAKN